MFVDASIMNETAKRQFKMSNLDRAILHINKEIVEYANRGLTEVTTISGYYSILTEHERSFISVELRNHGYNCRWRNLGKPNCCLHISWRNA